LATYDKERNMSIGKQLIEQLRQLANSEGATPADGAPLIVAGQPDHARLDFFDHDRYSVALRELVVGMNVDAPADTRTYLSAAAAAVARGLSFLEEPLAVWELDGSEGMAQLRSSPPLREGDEASYWEVTLTADQPTARAARYRWAPGMPEREIVAYPATFALLGRMADALAGALLNTTD
jgi:hypothetical protein